MDWFFVLFVDIFLKLWYFRVSDNVLFELGDFDDGCYYFLIFYFKFFLGF